MGVQATRGIRKGFLQEGTLTLDLKERAQLGNLEIHCHVSEKMSQTIMNDVLRGPKNRAIPMNEHHCRNWALWLGRNCQLYFGLS